MKQEQNSTWAVALQTFVDKTKTIPPTLSYMTHPAWWPLMWSIKKRRAQHPEISSAGTAACILRETIYSGDTLTISGYSSPEMARECVREVIRQMRTYPDARRCRGEMWRYWQREKLLIADLLEESPPECELTRQAWQEIRDCYIPKQSHLNSNITWVA